MSNIFATYHVHFHFHKTNRGSFTSYITNLYYIFKYKSFYQVRILSLCFQSQFQLITTFFSLNTSEGVQNEPPQNVSLWHVDYLELKMIKALQEKEMVQEKN